MPKQPFKIETKEIDICNSKLILNGVEFSEGEEIEAEYLGKTGTAYLRFSFGKWVLSDYQDYIPIENFKFINKLNIKL